MSRSMARAQPELAAFVRAMRLRLTPAEAGLPTGGRRRTAGLRREEVASRAGVGLTWYTWFEQGRDIKVSETFLLAVAKALQLEDDECQHLFLLAHRRPPAAEAYHVPEIDGVTRRVLDAISAPAMVLSLKRDILAVNASCTALFAGAFAPGLNLLRAVFFDKAIQARMPLWNEDAAALAAALRLDLATVPDDPLMRALEQELNASATFRATRDPANARSPRNGFSAWDEDRFTVATMIADPHRQVRIVVYLPG